MGHWDFKYYMAQTIFFFLFIFVPSTTDHKAKYMAGPIDCPGGEDRPLSELQFVQSLDERKEAGVGYHG